MAQIPFVRKKKTEIVAEYEKLLTQLDELKTTSQLVYQPQSVEIIEKAKSQTTEAMKTAIAELKTSFARDIGKLSYILDEQLTALTNGALKALEVFSDLQEAITISKKQLEVQHHIAVAADTLEGLVAEYHQKTKQLEAESAAEKLRLDTEIANKRRDSEREQEEYAYTLKINRQRVEALFAEEQKKREGVIKERELTLKNQETELISLRQQVADFPARSERELKIQADKLVAQLDTQGKEKMAAAKKDWEAEKYLLESRIKTLEEVDKRQDGEIIRLRKEAESAYQKAQQLAVKVIESGAGLRVSGDSQEKSRSAAPGNLPLAL